MYVNICELRFIHVHTFTYTTTTDNTCTCMPCMLCGHGCDVGKSYAHHMTKTKLTQILMLILIPTLTLTLLTPLTVLPLDSHGSVVV